MIPIIIDTVNKSGVLEVAGIQFPVTFPLIFLDESRKATTKSWSEKGQARMSFRETADNKLDL